MHSMVFPRPVPGCSSSRSDVLVTLVEPWLISRSSFCCDASWRGSGGLSGPHSALEAFIGILICRRDTQQGVVSTRAHARVPLWLRVRVASAPNAYVRPLDVRMSLGRTSHGRASHGRALALAYPFRCLRDALRLSRSGILACPYWVGGSWSAPPRAPARKPCAPRFLERAPPHSFLTGPSRSAHQDGPSVYAPRRPDMLWSP